MSRMLTARQDSPAARVGGDFDDFFREHYRRLFQGLCLLTGDRSEADDLAQESFVRVLERWDRVRAMGSPVGYLYRTSLNLHRSALRRTARWAGRILPRPPAEDPFEPVEARAVVLRAVGTLPPRQREALVLVEWLDATVEETAHILGIEPVSVRSRLHRARRALRDAIGGIDG